MMNGIAVGSTSLATMLSAINTVSNNIANANTEGFSRTDVMFSDTKVGGVTSSSTILFDPYLASKISALISQDANLSAALSNQNSLQTSLSSLNTAISDSVSDLKTSFSALDSAQDDPAAKAVANESLKSIASIYNSELDSLDAFVSNLTQTNISNMSSLNDKLNALKDFNKKSLEFRTSSEGVNYANQLVQSISELAGGTPRFNSDGTVSYSLGNSSVIEASSSLIDPSSLDITEGKIGGVNLSIQNLQNSIADLKSTINNFAVAVNASNANGTTTAGAAGGDLYSVTVAGRLTYVGTANGLATHSAAGLTFGSRMTTALNDAVTQTSSTAATAGALYNTYKAQSSLYSSSLNNAKEEYISKNGVNSDLEAVKLAAYQKTYEAMAQVLKVQGELISTIINTTA